MINRFLYQFIVICAVCACRNDGNGNQNSGNISDTNTKLNTEQKAFIDASIISNNDTPESISAKTVNSAPQKKSGSPAQRNSSSVQVKTLKEVYNNFFSVGTAITPEKDLKDAATVNLIKTQFSSLTAKTAMQPFKIHPKEKEYNWQEADMLVDFAQKNNIEVRGHCLIYASRDKHMPAWFYKDGNKRASKELILKRMKDHITAVLTRYKGKVYCWDVVNEAMRKTDSLYAIMGEEYITKAFEFAREADPSVKLFYNDGFYDDAQRDKFYKLIKKWKSQGVPIDGIGMQYHLGIEGKSADGIQKDIDAFSSLGLEVQVTELDVSIYPRTSTPKSVQDLSDEFTPTLENKQAMVYKTIFDVCRKNKDKVTGITIWGTGDGDSFLIQRLNKKNYPYVFSGNLQPKKAFDAIVNF